MHGVSVLVLSLDLVSSPPFKFCIISLSRCVPHGTGRYTPELPNMAVRPGKGELFQISPSFTILATSFASFLSSFPIQFTVGVSKCLSNDQLQGRFIRHHLSDTLNRSVVSIAKFGCTSPNTILKPSFIPRHDHRSNRSHSLSNCVRLLSFGGIKDLDSLRS